MSKKNAKTFGKARVFRAPVVVGRDTFTITLPKKLIEYLDLQAGEIFWSPVNGVVQISGAQPHMIIPMITVDEDGFLPQDEQRQNRVVEEE